MEGTGEGTSKEKLMNRNETKKKEVGKKKITLRRQVSFPHLYLHNLQGFSWG